MPEEDQDTLAAEYVLGTLSAHEREQAEALRSFDPGFEAAVRQWERRLGELNVMVEAVEPPPETWDKIKARLGSTEPSGEAALLHDPESLPPVAGLAADALPGPSEPPPAAAPSAAAPQPASASDTAALATQTVGDAATVPSTPQPRAIEPGADTAGLARRADGWQRAFFAVAALAALLALYIAAWQFAPERIPAFLRPHMTMRGPTSAPARPPHERLVAVLQQEPTTPAFLLTIDMQRRTLTVRRVSATPETGKSYELWLISRSSPAPRSLGIIGNDEFTARAIPMDDDAETLSAASFVVSLEPAGGSTRGVPSGPILFTGKAVESLPAPMPPAAPKTPGS